MNWCLIRRLSVNLPRNALLTLYKSFIRPHLDYSDISYDKQSNKNFQKRKSSILSLLCNNRYSTRDLYRKNYDKLGLHSLAKRCWQSIEVNIFSQNCTSFTLRLPLFISGLLLSFEISFEYCCKTLSFKNKIIQRIFFSCVYCINEWNNLTVEIKNAKSINIFKKSIIIEKQKNSLFTV